MSPYLKPFTAAALFLALLLPSCDTQAQVVPVGFPVTQVGNQIYFGPTAVTSANVGQFTFAPAAAAGSGVAVSAGRKVATGASAGEVIDVVAKTVVPRATVAATLVKAAVKLVPVVQVGAAGYELWKLLNENNIEGEQGPNGTEFKEKIQEGGCPNNTAYKLATRPNGATGCTPQLACEANGGSWNLDPRYPPSCFAGNVNLGTNTVAVTQYPSERFEPRTPQQVTDIISNRIIETSPRIPQAIKDAIATGESLPAPQPTSVTGPATGPAGQPTTTVNPDGSKVVSTPSSSITYGGNTITVNNVTTVTNISPTGTTTGTTTTTAPAKPTETPAAEDPCVKNPTRIGCSEYGTPDAPQLDKTSSAVTVTAVAFASSATCPAPLTFNVKAATYTVSYEPLCDRLALLKTLFLAMAGFVAAYVLANSFRV